MAREDELAAVRDQVSIVAEQAARLLEVIAARTRRGWDVQAYEEQLERLETMMWKLHRRHSRLKAEVDPRRLMPTARAAARRALQSR